MQRKTGVFHSFIAEKLLCLCEKEHTDTLTRAQVRKVMYYSHIPVICHNDFLKEMQAYGLVEVIDKRNIRVMKPTDGHSPLKSRIEYMLNEGMTQSQVALVLDINQSSVSRILKGY